MKKILLYFIIYVGIQLIISLVTGVVWSELFCSSGMSAEQMIVASSLSNAIAAVVFICAKWTPVSLRFFNKKALPVVYWCILLSLGMIIPSSALESLIPESMTQDVLKDVFKLILGSPWGYIAIGLFAPLVEEIVFRGAIQTAAMKHFKAPEPTAGAYISKRVIMVMVFTALLFAVVHGNPAQMPHAFLVGLLLSWLRYRSGSIVPGIIVHWINNSVSYILYAVYPRSYDMQVIEFFGNSELRLALACLLSLCLFAPALWQLHKALK